MVATRGTPVLLSNITSISEVVNTLFSDDNIDRRAFKESDNDGSDCVFDYTVVATNGLVSGTELSFNDEEIVLDSDGFHVAIVSGTDGTTGWYTLTSSQWSIDYDVIPHTVTFNLDIPLNSVIQIYDRTDHRIGWGQPAIAVPSSGEALPILADEIEDNGVDDIDINTIVDTVNLIRKRTIGSSTVDYGVQGAVVRAGTINDIEDVLDEVQTGDTYWTAAETDTNYELFSWSRSDPWITDMKAAIRFTWNSYDEYRYYFNSGGKLHFEAIASGDTGSQGYINWSQVTNGCGRLTLDYDTVTQDGDVEGESAGLGAYELTPSYQTIFTSASPLSPVDTAGNFANYSDFVNMKLIWTARLIQDNPSTGQVSLYIRINYLNQALGQLYDGTITFVGGSSVPAFAERGNVSFTVATDFNEDSIEGFEEFLTSGISIPEVETGGSYASLGIPYGTDISSGFTIDTGYIDVIVTVEDLGGLSFIQYMDDANMYVASGEPFDEQDGLSLGFKLKSDSYKIVITFKPHYGVKADTEVTDVKFRISDIDRTSSRREYCRMYAYDKNQNEVPVQITPGSAMTYVESEHKVWGLTAHNNKSSDWEGFSALFEVAGPTARVEIYVGGAKDNSGSAQVGQRMTQVFFTPITYS